jgi:hypothetical protein
LGGQSIPLLFLRGIHSSSPFSSSPPSKYMSNRWGHSSFLTNGSAGSIHVINCVSMSLL